MVRRGIAYSGLAALALVATAFSASARAEIVSTIDGDLTVIESVAPLGAGLKYDSGGNGLIGFADSWPTMADTPANRAFAVEAYDHTWMQYDPAIIWSSSLKLSQVLAVPGVDHGPSPFENLEFIIWGSNDKVTWEEGKITAIYRDGFDTALTTVGQSDDYTSLWSFSTGYNFFQATSGDHLTGGPFSAGEGEIDALAAVANVPEPGTATIMLGCGLCGLVLAWRRRRLS